MGSPVLEILVHHGGGCWTLCIRYGILQIDLRIISVIALACTVYHSLYSPGSSNPFIMLLSVSVSFDFPVLVIIQAPTEELQGLGFRV